MKVPAGQPASTSAVPAGPGADHVPEPSLAQLRQLVAELRGSEARAQQSARRAAQLQEATSALAATLTTQDVSEGFLSLSERVFGAAAGVVYLYDASGQLRLHGGRGVPAVDQRLAVLPQDAPLPLAEAVAGGQALWFESHQELICRYPAIASSPTPAERLQAVAALPIVHGSRVLGGFALSFDSPRRFGVEEREWLERFAAQCAVAVERARLYAAEREARGQAEALAATMRAGEEKYRRLLDEMAETVRLNDLIIGVLAHDLRNPLTGIVTSVQLARLRSHDVELGRPLTRIQSSAERMMRMVEQLLDFARVRLGQTMPLSPGPEDLGLILRHVVEEFAEAAQGRVAVEQAGDPAGEWDGDRLGQVFSNLVGNALQHGRPGPIRVRVDGLDPERITVTVHNGGAIPAAAIPGLFQPFGGGDRPRATSRGGLGLGLYIARQIVHGHGGRLGVESSEDAGTTFTLVLPRTARVAQAEAATPGRALAEARERVWQSEQRMRMLVESIRDYGIFMLDTQGRVVTWNLGAQRMKGYSADEIVGKSIATFYTPEDLAQDRPAKLLREAVTNHRVEDLGWRVRKDGSLFWADVIITALRDSSGQLCGFAKVTRDLSDRKEGVERLRRSEEQFQLMVASVTDYAIFKLDPRGIVATWNAGAERIKGYAPSEIIGQHFSRFYEPEEVRAGKCEMELEVAGREGRFEDEGWRVRKDGTRFWANVIITALRDAGGTLLGFSKVTRDLTERRKLEDERVRRARAEEAIRLRDEFLTLASHELKTPLTGLQLQLQALAPRLDAGDHRVATALRRALSSGDRLATLIDSLLDVSRITAGQLELATESFDLNLEVATVIDGVRAPAASLGSPVELRSQGALVGRWDRARIQQMLGSLLSNAIKYGAGAPIEVSLSRQEDQAELVVRDHGPGLGPEDAGLLFERFGRGEATRNLGGLGLSLFVVREIVRAHGGQVAADNAPGGGASFTIRLPLEPA